MVLTEHFHYDFTVKKGQPPLQERVYTKWRIENSWGSDNGKDGYLLMTDEWFSEYVYEVVVNKRLVTAEVLDVLKQEPVVLIPWNPMGSLA